MKIKELLGKLDKEVNHSIRLIYITKDKKTTIWYTTTVNELEKAGLWEAEFIEWSLFDYYIKIYMNIDDLIYYHNLEPFPLMSNEGVSDYEEN